MRGSRLTTICAAILLALLKVSMIPAHARLLQLEPMSLVQASQLINFEKISALGRINVSIGSPMQELEVSCFATGLYHEARGEDRKGQLAVAQVILNRMKSEAYPDTACGVIYQNAHMRNRCQFSFACDRRSDNIRNSEVYAALRQIADQTLRHGQAPFAAELEAAKLQSKLREATHYHTKAVSPAWGRKIEKLTTIGAHIFYRSERVAKSL